jgi:uracil-DNA glycosylase family 4
LARVRASHPGYHARPVSAFGDRRARLLIVGLAPGMHGANRTGRPFTGDFAGILLYRTLYEHGFSNRPESVSATDRLRLRDCRITNAVKCLPPANKPTPKEIATCNDYLAAELSALPAGSVVLALGTIAHRATLRALGLKMTAFRFRHGVHHRLPDRLHLLDSYHCSRYNTQTRRLTPAMFSAVVRKSRRLLAK